MQVSAGRTEIHPADMIYIHPPFVVWRYHAAVLVSLAVLWLIQLILWCMEVISVQIQPAYLPVMGHTCTSHENLAVGGAPFVATAVVDLTASILIAVRLYPRRQHADESKVKKLRRLLVKDALVSLSASECRLSAD